MVEDIQRIAGDLGVELVLREIRSSKICPAA
jgi:hypothetical protein